MTVEPAVVVSVISVIISLVSVVCAIVFSVKNSKRTDTKDIEERVRENTRILTKLDDISDSIKEIKRDNADAKSEMQKHNDRIIKVEESSKNAHHRIDEIVENCRTCGGKCHE